MLTNTRRAILIFILCLNTLSAHQDKILSLMDGSKIEGLPERYEQSFVNWKAGELIINKKVAKLPKFLGGIFSSDLAMGKNGSYYFKPDIVWELEVSASWFHDKNDQERLPDYLLITLRPIKKDYYFTIFIDMEKVNVVGTQIRLNTFSKENGDSWVNRNEKKMDGLTDMWMDLVLDEKKESIWDRTKTKKKGE